METATQKFTIDDLGRLESSVPRLTVSTDEPLRLVTRRGTAGVWGLALAFSVLTGPVQYVDQRTLNTLSGAASVVWEVRRRRGQAITLREARAIALKMLAEAEREIRADWQLEARRFATLWENEDLSI